jgi:hypothetical protein
MTDWRAGMMCKCGHDAESHIRWRGHCRAMKRRTAARSRCGCPEFVAAPPGVCVVSVKPDSVLGQMVAARGEPAPRLIRCEYGGWLAVSPPGAFVSIGVFAWSADDARDRFHREMQEWRELLARDWSPAPDKASVPSPVSPTALTEEGDD